MTIYGILIALAIVVGVVLCGKNEERLGLPKETALDFALFAVPFALVGARLYYVAFEWESYRNDLVRILYVWEGGLAIYGGIIGGIIGALILSKVRKLSFFALADMVMPSLLLGQAIGRWGNYFNGEAFGNLVTDAALQFFPYAVNVSGAWYQATFFYESMWDLAGFFILWFTRKKWKRGDGFFWYFIYYGIGRMWIEGLRSDSLMLGDIRVSQLLSLVMVVVSAAVMLVRHVRLKRADLQSEK